MTIITGTSVLLALLVALRVSATLEPEGPDEQAQFDYIVVGGGTAGLTVANRLSEDPDVSVAVLEAGTSQRTNPNVTRTDVFGLGLSTDIDYQYNSTPQVYANDKPVVYHSGKALGGTSTINGMTYIRPDRAQIDAWQDRLGNPEWSWEDLFPTYLYSEKFQPPTPAQADDGVTYDPSAHGYSGPVHVGWQNELAGRFLYDAVESTWTQDLGFTPIDDVNTGEPGGFSVWPLTLDRLQNIRWDAAQAYLWPIVEQRQNLHVFPETVAENLVWDEKDCGGNEGLMAKGVALTTRDGGKRTILASKEVVVSAGSLRSPPFLEKSGVGNPSVLSNLSTPIKHALPSLGFHLQDQPQTVTIAPLAPNVSVSGYSTYVTNANVTSLFPDTDITTLESDLRAAIPGYAAQIAATTGTANATTPEIQSELLTLQADLIFKQGVPLAEFLTEGLAGRFGVVGWGLLPFSRGSVHASPGGGAATPDIDPAFFMLDWDRRVSVAVAKMARRALEAPSLKGLVGEEASPGKKTVPEGADDDAWERWILNSCMFSFHCLALRINATFRDEQELTKTDGPNYHPVSTLPMLPPRLGGVVDPDLKVYGTRNVRVVDASVFPGQVVGHLSGTVYAVAEMGVRRIMGNS